MFDPNSAESSICDRAAGFTSYESPGIIPFVLGRPSPRVVSGLLLSMLMFLPGCEPDECSVDFAYRVNGADLYEYVWRQPSTNCSVFDLGLASEGASITYANGTRLLDISLKQGSFTANTSQAVSIFYTDDNLKTWNSEDIGLSGQEPSACFAAIESVEEVDWVSLDHVRIRGVVECAGPLYSTNPSSFEYDELELSEIKFLIYAPGVLR